VILSLEMHCSLEQQGVLADMLRDAFGDRLVEADELATDLVSDLSAIDSPQAAARPHDGLGGGPQ
jgi:hypothetical protein